MFAGAQPDQRHRMTRRDLMDGNADLVERAGEILARGTPRTLEAQLSGEAGLSLVLTTRALTSVDAYVNGRPAATTPLDDGTTTLAVPLPPETGAGLTVRLEGFDGNTLVAARTLQLTTA